MPEGTGDLIEGLAAARGAAVDSARKLVLLSELIAELTASERPRATACRGLVELLELDAAWLVEDGAVSCCHRPETAPHQRLRGLRPVQLAATATGGACRRIDSRHAVVMAPSPLGAVLIGARDEAAPFADADLAIVRALAAVVPSATGAAAAGEAAAARLDLLRSLSIALVGAHTEADVARVVVTELRRMIAYDACRFYLLDAARGVAAPLAVDGVGQAYRDDSFEDLECRLGEGIAGTVVHRGERLVIGNALGHPLAAPIPGSDPADESVVALPLPGETATIGALVVTREGVNQWSEGDVRLLEAVAATAAAACESARAQAETREAAEIAETLLDLGAVLSLPSDVHGIADLLVRAVDRMVECAAIQFWLRDGSEMVLAAQVGHTPPVAERLAATALPAVATPFAEALDTRRVTIRGLDGIGPLAPLLGRLPAGSTLAVVALGERAASRGAIVIQRGPRRGPPDARDQRMLQGIADQALMAITNATLYADLERSFLETVQALANALETKDSYTADHAQALIGLCTSVATRIGITGTDLRDISFAAALHDIGKIGIPAEILNKPGSLTADEFEVMKRHPELGARIIAPVAALRGARDLVVACHEHWDGSGYPLGLRGAQIPLGARVILACDAFHAMTSDRVYRAAMTLPEAVAELRRCSGSHFDPEVAGALIDAIAGTAADRRQPASVA